MGRSEEITGLKYDKSLYTDCGFYAGDMDDSYIGEEEKLVKCRKPHKCSACQRDINKGEYAVRETAIFPGEGRRSCYTCTTCIEAWLEESGQAGEGDSGIMSDEYILKRDAVDYCKALMNAELVQNTDDWGYGKERYNQTEVILEFIENRQPADVVPVVHGEWLPTNDDNKKKCNKCDTIVLIAMYPTGNANFCPNCGAKMDAR